MQSLQQLTTENTTLETPDYSYHFSHLIEKGPESENEYQFLDSFFLDIAQKRENGDLTDDELKQMREAFFRKSLTTSKTLQGHVTVCPRGYYGDFEIIDKIYTNHLAPEQPFRNWDQYFQAQAMPQAVRNRKTYFLNKLSQLPEGSRILNLASGPCRDLLEFDQTYHKHLVIDCVDLDQDAIDHAKGLLEGTDLEVQFQQANIFRFTTDKQYDLIWSAGLFDYFDDKIFARILERFSANVKPGGNMIIGNFRKDKAKVAYMEFADWFLNYRTEEELLTFAEEVECKEAVVEQEELGLNLFLNLLF